MSCPLRQSPGGDSHSPTGGNWDPPWALQSWDTLYQAGQGNALLGQGWSPAAAWPCHKPEQDPELHRGGAENILALQGLLSLSDQSRLLSPQNGTSS